MKTKSIKQIKQGISLIVLVITIIVMIILAAAVILSLSSNGIIDRANEAVDKTNENQVKAYAQMIWSEAFLDGKRGAELVNFVETELEKQGVNSLNYSMEISDSGMDIQKFDTTNWEFAYTYDQTEESWSGKILSTDSETLEGDIIVKFYNLGKKVQPKSGEFEGQPVTFVSGDAYKMVIEGTGEMGVTDPFWDPENSAWQYDTALYVGGTIEKCIIPYVTEAVLAKGVTNIGSGAFFAATSLNKVSIADTVQEIGHGAFMYAKSLTSIVIPHSVISIGENIFDECDNLNSIHVESKEEWDNITLPSNNVGIIDLKVTHTYRTKVERVLTKGWQLAYENGNNTVSALENAVLEYAFQNGLTWDMLNTYDGEITTKGINISPKELTLGELIKSPRYYGKTVNYTANGINDWKVLYKQTVDGQEYVYLIASKKLPGSKIPKNIPGTIVEGDSMSWATAPTTVSSEQINYSLWLANWSNYGVSEQAKAVTYLLDEQYWNVFKNTEKYGENVVGAIGTPTFEMIVESYNQRTQALGDSLESHLITYTNGEKGYILRETEYGRYFDFPRNDSLYVWSHKEGTAISLASPVDEIQATAFGCFELDMHNGYHSHYGILLTVIYENINYYNVKGLRPVVCIKATTPAKMGLSGDAADIMLIDN